MSSWSIDIVPYIQEPLPLYYYQKYPSYRRATIVLLYHIFEKYDEYYELNIDSRRKLIDSIELACYEMANIRRDFIKSEKQSKSLRMCSRSIDYDDGGRRYETARVVDSSYRSICYTITSHLDKLDSYENIDDLWTPPATNSTPLPILLINGIVDPAAAVAMSASQMNPEASAEIENEIQERMNIAKPEVKICTIWTCPRCKARKTTFKEAQTRSLDEGATIIVTCLECGKVFRG
jgi:DNA-directed RNA polymerase subunit M/transcription elongation factor TFIIS